MNQFLCCATMPGATPMPFKVPFANVLARSRRPNRAMVESRLSADAIVSRQPTTRLVIAQMAHCSTSQTGLDAMFRFRPANVPRAKDAKMQMCEPDIGSAFDSPAMIAVNQGQDCFRPHSGKPKNA